MIELEDAQRRIATLVEPLASESVPLSIAYGRFAAEHHSAPAPLPPFDNSAMDGYAVRADDVKAVSPDNPAVLRLIGQAAAGQIFSGEIGSRQCVRVFTGSPLPRGADAVVMQEDTRLDPAGSGEVFVIDSVKAWENVRFRGEDLKAGDIVLDSGDRLTAGRLGLLSALGLNQVRTWSKPVVGLIATGTELREAGERLEPGQIYESNRATLGWLIESAGAQPRAYPLVPDTLDATRAALETAFAECDAVVSSGGVSVGELDYIKAAFQQLGGEITFWRVAIKPGKPFVFGRWGKKLLFGLPGNPVSAFVTFLLLVRPAVLRMQGATETGLAQRRGELVEALVNRGDRRHFMRVSIDRSAHVRSSGPQASHLLHSLARSNGLVDVPAGAHLAAGTIVSVLQWESAFD